MNKVGDKLVIATHNAGKLREIRELLAPYGLGDEVRLVFRGVVPEGEVAVPWAPVAPWSWAPLPGCAGDAPCPAWPIRAIIAACCSGVMRWRIAA